MIKDLYKFKFEIFLLMISVAASVLLSYGTYIFVWGAFSPLIYLAFKTNTKKTATFGIIYGILTSILFFTWVYDINLEYRIELYSVTILIFTIFFVLFLAAVSFFSKKIKSSFVVLLAPVVWVLLLSIYSFLPLKIYWMDFAIFQPSIVPLIWYVGSYGITFLIILFNSIVACYFVKRNKNLLFLILFLISIVLLSYLYSNYSDFPYNGNRIKVALLQGNFPYSWEWRQNNSFGVILETYLNMTNEASKTGADIIVWPEYSLADDITKNENVFKKLKKTAELLNVTLIVGSPHYVDEERYKDTAFVFKPDGSFETYDSVEPVFLEDFVVKGENKSPLSHESNKFGVTICNEEIIQSIARDYTKKNASFIVSMSNNQFFGRGRYIISQFIRLRAAENAKYIIRATNDGITQIVNPLGRVIYSAEPKKQKILIGDIYGNNYKTFYTKYGNILVYFLIISSVIVMIKKR